MFELASEAEDECETGWTRCGMQTNQSIISPFVRESVMECVALARVPALGIIHCGRTPARCPPWLSSRSWSTMAHLILWVSLVRDGPSSPIGHQA